MPPRGASLYYTFSEEFDYREYLETRSHFESIETSIEDQARNLITSNENIGENISNALGKVDVTLHEGFARIEVALENISNSIDTLSAICAHGFMQVETKLIDIDQQLKELVSLVKSPDHTWAMEKYRAAVKLAQHAEAAKAIEFLDRAIGGDENNSGYDIEYRFFFLRGLLRLGDFKNFSPDIVDLELARIDLNMAVKYASMEDDGELKKCLAYLGWCEYCLGNFSDAEASYSHALLSGNSEARTFYEASKVAARLNDIEKAADRLAKSFKKNKNYVIIAGSDLDFVNDKMIIKKAIKLEKLRIRRDLARLSRKYDALDISSLNNRVSKFFAPLPELDSIKWENADNRIRSLPLLDALEARNNMAKQVVGVKKDIEACIDKVRKKQDVLKNYMKSFNPESTKFELISRFTALIFGVGAAIKFVSGSFDENFFIGLLSLFGFGIVLLAVYFATLLGFVAILTGAHLIFGKPAERKIDDLEEIRSDLEMAAAVRICD